MGGERERGSRQVALAAAAAAAKETHLPPLLETRSSIRNIRCAAIERK